MASGNVSFAPRRTSVGRTTAGLLALAYPLLMVVMALAVGSREPGNLQDFAASFVAAVMLVIALPTTWFLSFDFIEVSRTTVVVFGLVTSLPRYGPGGPLGELGSMVPPVRDRRDGVDAREHALAGSSGSAGGLLDTRHETRDTRYEIRDTRYETISHLGSRYRLRCATGGQCESDVRRPRTAVA